MPRSPEGPDMKVQKNSKYPMREGIKKQCD